MNELYQPTLETVQNAQRAAQAMLGVGPDPREAGFWNTYLTVGAKEFAQLLDALNVPRIGAAAITTNGATLLDADANEVSRDA